jgi:O-antigen/teichoic acid export membrane protein
MNLRWRFLKNAVANLGRGGLTGLVALVLPPVLVRHMTPAAYAVWVLILQACAYVGYLDFGLQTAVGRYIAFAAEKQDTAQRDSVFSTAFAGLALAALLSIVLLLAAAAIAPWIFPAIPAALVPQMRWALLIVGTATALGLPASAWNGVFIGLQRNEAPAITVGGARLLSAIGLVLVVLAGGSVVAMAAVMAATLLVSYAVQYLLIRRLVPDIRFHGHLAQRSTGVELSRYCTGLMVMSFSMLLVTGLDLVLVARFDFAAVTPYSVAAALITFVAGALYSIINVVMPHAAGLHAKGDSIGLGKLVISSTRLSVLLLAFICTPAVIYAGPILKLWIGQRYVQTGAPILVVLVIANFVRLIGAAYSVVLVAAGQQSQIKVSPLTEGISNLVASLVLGAMFGGIGVALGTLVGSFFSIAAHLFYSMPRTRVAIGLSVSEFLWSGVGMPLMATVFLLVAAAFSVLGMQPGVPLFVAALLLSLLGTAAFLDRTGMLRTGGRTLLQKAGASL